jgi:ClpP class serine protease
MKSGIVPTPEQMAASVEEEGYVVAGGNAAIPIEGVLTNQPSFYARYYGGGNTTYPAIRDALARAEADPEVRTITLRVNSPGGQINGLFETLEMLQSLRKPLKAEVTDMAASAAYAIVAQAEDITLRTPASRVGSVGVVVDMVVYDDEVSITSTNAPNKRPDVTTEEGKAQVRAELDDLHELFVDAIAEGRGTTTEDVNTNFGRGAMLVAKDAIARGMADSLSGTNNNTAAPIVAASAKNGGKRMDLATLKAEHPAVYQAAVAEGQAQGIEQERDRVSAHLTLGNASGIIATALEAVEAGTGLTESIKAKYQAAGMKQSLAAARTEDNPEPTATETAAAETPTLDDNHMAAGMCDALDKLCGVSTVKEV